MLQRVVSLALFLTTASCACAIGQASEMRLSSLPGAARRTILEALSPDMPWLQLAELTGSDGTSIDQFGLSVAIDGNSVVVGAPYAKIGSNQAQGAAYVFVKPATGWENMTQVAKLTASDGKADDEFGGSVAISGKTVLVGDTFFSRVGGYIFVRPTRGWKSATETAKLQACGPIGAIRGDTAVCADLDQAFVYVRPKTGWKSATTYDALLVTTEGDKNFFSSIATDGDVVVIGAADINNESDVAYLYVKPKGGWGAPLNLVRLITQKAKLTNSDSTEGDGFGFSVSLSGDTVAVGAPYAPDNNENSGAAYVFVRPASGWTNMTETAKLTANTTSYPSILGWSVAVSGETLVAGNPSGENTDNHQGEAFVYLEPATGWSTTSTPNARLTASDDQADDPFGWSVAMSGQTILVGDISVAFMGPGAAYVFGP